MLVRMAKLLAVSAFYIGRLDTPLFAPGVGMMGPMALDGHPIQFRKDLLLHDAHRHPYMERLGVIYLLKLRHGEHFGNRAGGQWRLIFVMALMPWLRRYRLDDNPISTSNNKDSDGRNGERLEGDSQEFSDTLLDEHEMKDLRSHVKKLHDRFGKEETNGILQGLILPM